MMDILQRVVKTPADVAAALQALAEMRPQWVLVFGAAPFLHEVVQQRAVLAGDVRLLGCSTAGEISGQGVTDGGAVLTGLRFAATTLVSAATPLADMGDSASAGQRLAQALAPDGLRAVWVLGQGVGINGSALIDGLRQGLPADVRVTGGLAGDDGAFAQTAVLLDDQVRSNWVVALGLYGAGLRVTHGTFGGWAPFGPARRVTACAANVLLSLDDEPALAVYKRYLGDHARGLPASGLLFPFLMLGQGQAQTGLIRTILGVDEARGALILAGDIDPDGYLQLMHASTDALVDGAEVAAMAAAQALHSGDAPVLALLVSCVGRKLVMGGRVEEEVEAVRDCLPASTVLAGFYSYGEISPFSLETACQLHNQTMTITTWSEPVDDAG